jgi:hypothetical protein
VVEVTLVQTQKVLVEELAVIENFHVHLLVQHLIQYQLVGQEASHQDLDIQQTLVEEVQVQLEMVLQEDQVEELPFKWVVEQQETNLQ